MPLITLAVRISLAVLAKGGPAHVYGVQWKSVPYVTARIDLSRGCIPDILSRLSAGNAV
jgi:hypothetical protein